MLGSTPITAEQLAAEKTDERIIRAATDFALCAIEIRGLRRTVKRCTEESPSDYECGDPGACACRFAGPERSEWCEPCVQAESVYQSVRPLKRKQALAKERLMRAVAQVVRECRPAKAAAEKAVRNG